MRQKLRGQLIVASAFVLAVVPTFCANQQVALAQVRELTSISIVFPLLAPKLSSKFGSRNHPVRKVHRHHNGVDLAAPKGSHVRAVADGVVVFSDALAGYGKLVTITHAQGFSSLYGHLNELRVNPGDKVTAGKIIGRVGSTGLATGPHLHFEWRRYGKSIDPLKAFPELADTPQG